MLINKLQYNTSYAFDCQGCLYTSIGGSGNILSLKCYISITVKDLEKCPIFKFVDMRIRYISVKISALHKKLQVIETVEAMKMFLNKQVKYGNPLAVKWLINEMICFKFCIRVFLDQPESV